MVGVAEGCGWMMSVNAYSRATSPRIRSSPWRGNFFGARLFYQGPAVGDRLWGQYTPSGRYDGASLRSPPPTQLRSQA
jgi:hypothetical protein